MAGVVVEVNEIDIFIVKQLYRVYSFHILEAKETRKLSLKEKTK